MFQSDISPADLHAAAKAAGLTVGQFEARAIAQAVRRYLEREATGKALLAEAERAIEDALGVAPGGDW